jgi:hypothetical protein
VRYEGIENRDDGIGFYNLLLLGCGFLLLVLGLHIGAERDQAHVSYNIAIRQITIYLASWYC